MDALTPDEALDAAERFAEQAKIPFTDWQKRVLAAVLAGDREEVEYAAWYEPPVQTCINLTDVNGRGMSMSAFDQALRDVYAPGLRDAINNSRSFFDMIVKAPERKRVWWQPWTWRRVQRWLPKGMQYHPNYEGRKCVWDVKVVESKLCPPGQAFLLNTDALEYGDPGDWMDDDWSAAE